MSQPDFAHPHPLTSVYHFTGDIDPRSLKSGTSLDVGWKSVAPNETPQVLNDRYRCVHMRWCRYGQLCLALTLSNNVKLQV